MATRIQFRRGTTSNWSSANPTLAEGEIGIETDGKKLKIGNGTQAWNDLPYGGLQGIQGTQGVQGVQGVQGLQGTQGTQGTAGFVGSNGAQGTQGTDGTQGVQGIQGTQGVQGTEGVGTQGTAGTQGTQGVMGTSGGSTSNFNYRASTTTTDSKPGAGSLRWNNATQTSATFLYVDHINDSAVDIDVYLGLVKQYDNVIIQEKEDSNVYITYEVTGAVTVVSNSYVKIPVTRVGDGGSGSNSFANNHAIELILFTTGLQGPIGAQGSVGPQGTQGVQGTTGTQGVQGTQGTQGVQGTLGTQGTVGAQGTVGSQGATGTQGTLGTAEISRFKFTATAGQTSVSGTDDNSQTLAYAVGKEQVYLNGLLLARTADYTASTGTSITSLAALALNDIVEIIAYTPFAQIQTVQGTQGTVGAQGTQGIQGSSYLAPTIGSTSIASGATVTTIAGLTLTAPTLTGTVTVSGDINLSAASGPGSLIDELTLLLMGAI